MTNLVADNNCIYYLSGRAVKNEFERPLIWPCQNCAHFQAFGLLLVIHIVQKAGNIQFKLLSCKFSRKLKVFVTNGGFLEKDSLFSIKTTFAFLKKTQIPNIGFQKKPDWKKQRSLLGANLRSTLVPFSDLHQGLYQLEPNLVVVEAQQGCKGHIKV